MSDLIMFKKPLGFKRRDSPHFYNKVISSEFVSSCQSSTFQFFLPNDFCCCSSSELIGAGIVFCKRVLPHFKMKQTGRVSFSASIVYQIEMWSKKKKKIHLGIQLISQRKSRNIHLSYLMIDSFTVEMVASETFIDSLINKLPYCY